MRYTKQEKKWLRENYPRLGMRETTRQFNELFNRSHKERTISAYCSRHLGLAVNSEVTSELMSRNHNVTCRNVTARRFFEEKEKEWLRKNYSKLGTVEATRQFNERFNHNKTCKTLKRYCSQWLGLHVDKETTSRIKSRPIGSTYKNCRGVWKIKTEDGWKTLSHTLKEVPKGHIAFHLDGDTDNNSPENIAVIKNGIQTIARNCEVLSEDPTITSVALTWAELYSEMKKHRRSKEYVE